MNSGENWFQEKRSEVRWTFISVFVTLVDVRVSVGSLAEDLRPSSRGTLNSRVANRTTDFSETVGQPAIVSDGSKGNHSGIVNIL